MTHETTVGVWHLLALQHRVHNPVKQCDTSQCTVWRLQNNCKPQLDRNQNANFCAPLYRGTTTIPRSRSPQLAPLTLMPPCQTCRAAAGTQPVPAQSWRCPTHPGCPRPPACHRHACRSSACSRVTLQADDLLHCQWKGTRRTCTCCISLPPRAPPSSAFLAIRNRPPVTAKSSTGIAHSSVPQGVTSKGSRPMRGSTHHSTHDGTCCSACPSASICCLTKSARCSCVMLSIFSAITPCCAF